MNEETLRTFKEKVFGQYYALKETTEKGAELQKFNAKRPESRIDSFFFGIAVFFLGKTFSQAQRKRLTARELISEPQIKRQICSSLYSLEISEDTDEILIIEKIVESLVPLSEASHVSIPLDDEFFAAVCHEILLMGVENYCTAR